MRDSVVSVLMSPDFCYRIDLRRRHARRPSRAAAPCIAPLSDYALASRLSYFLWSSMPDDELLAHAAAGDLHQPEVLAAQARRMLKDDRARGLAAEFGGNWLDFRRFEEHNAVDRERFPSFTNELRQAMFEEPIRFFVDVIRNNRSGPRFPLRQPHVRESSARQALRHARCRTRGRTNGCASTTRGQYGRGGLLPMAVFLTKNAPGLRTSPVKRGYWVVRRVLGEADSAAARRRAGTAARRSQAGPAAARDARPASRGPELRRLPRALRFARPGVRRLRPGRRAPRPRISPAAPSTPAPHSPAAAKATGFDGLRELHPRAPRRTISSTTSAASCWPTRSAAA